MTTYLYRIILDVTIKADSQKEAQEIADNCCLGWLDMDIGVWSSETQYKGIDEEGDE